MDEGQRQSDGRMSELAVSFLTDEDTVHPTDKIFWYMMG